MRSHGGANNLFLVRNGGCGGCGGARVCASCVTKRSFGAIDCVSVLSDVNFTGRPHYL